MHSGNGSSAPPILSASRCTPRAVGASPWVVPAVVAVEWEPAARCSQWFVGLLASSVAEVLPDLVSPVGGH